MTGLRDNTVGRVCLAGAYLGSIPNIHVHPLSIIRSNF